MIQHLFLPLSYVAGSLGALLLCLSLWKGEGVPTSTEVHILGWLFLSLLLFCWSVPA